MTVIEIEKDRFTLNIKVQTKSSVTGWGDVLQDTCIQLKINAPPVDGAANKACIKFIAKEFKTAKSQVSIIKGEKNRNKSILVKGFDAKRLKRFLEKTGLSA